MTLRRRLKRWVKWRIFKTLHHPYCSVHEHPTCGCDCYRSPTREWADDL